ncbi:hypothetical protein HDZ31DRAFT_69510, partial [Schizophyllum fasciatum]
AVALALSGYVQLLYNKGVLNNDRISFKTLLRFWVNFPSHFPAPAAVGGAHQEAEILFRGRDAAVTDLLLRVLTTPDPAGREAAAHAILMEGKGSANRLMRTAASRLTQSLRFAFIPRDRYAHEFPQLADHIVLRYRYAETADRGRHRHTCSAAPTGTALPPLTSSMPLSAKDHKFAVFAADREIKRKGKVRQAISAFLERPAVVKSGRDVHARIDCRKGVPSVMLCLSTGTMREAEPDDEGDENATGKVLLASSHDTAHASPRVIVDVVFSADREMAVVPVGMYRFSTFAPEKAQAKPALVSQPRRASRTPGMFVFGSCHPPERKQRRSTFRSRDTSWAYRFGTGVRHAFAPVSVQVHT